MGTRRLIVTGTGRCGTKYVSQALRLTGVSCGHEDVFTAEGFKGWGRWQADSSCLAMPFLDAHDGPIIHLVRHPLRTIGSLVGQRFFGREPDTLYTSFLYRHAPMIRGLEPLQAALAYYLNWNRGIEPFAYSRVRVEDVDSPVPKDLNTEHTRVPLSWEDLPRSGRKSLRRMAEDYGYE